MKINSLIVLVVVMVSFVGHLGLAKDHPEPTAFERSLSLDQGLYTNESVVDIGGRKFRKIEYRSEIFYLRLYQEGLSVSDLVVHCQELGAGSFNASSPNLVSAAVKVVKRTRLFIEGLKTMCTQKGNRSRVEVLPEVLIGFMFDDKKDDPKAVFKNKKIFFNPLTMGFGFAADW